MLQFTRALPYRLYIEKQICTVVFYLAVPAKEIIQDNLCPVVLNVLQTKGWEK
jgi:hypothetical protein